MKAAEIYFLKRIKGCTVLKKIKNKDIRKDRDIGSRKGGRSDKRERETEKMLIR
jgi:hypothetical protein